MCHFTAQRAPCIAGASPARAACRCRGLGEGRVAGPRPERSRGRLRAAQRAGRRWRGCGGLGPHRVGVVRVLPLQTSRRARLAVPALPGAMPS